MQTRELPSGEVADPDPVGPAGSTGGATADPHDRGVAGGPYRMDGNLQPARFAAVVEGGAARRRMGTSERIPGRGLAGCRRKLTDASPRALASR